MIGIVWKNEQLIKYKSGIKWSVLIHSTFSYDRLFYSPQFQCLTKYNVFKFNDTCCNKQNKTATTIVNVCI